MVDPTGISPNGFHLVKIKRQRKFKGKAVTHSRITRPPRYILVDLGLSREYNSRGVIDNPLRTSDKSAPECQLEEFSNPFQTDIYYLGLFIRENFILVCNSTSRSTGRSHRLS
jgi:hypothetical protein